MNKKKKPIKEQYADVEIDEHISIDKDKIPEYPKKACITFNNHFYYLYNLYHRLVVERVSFEEVRV